MINYAGTLKFLRTKENNIQYGLDIHLLELSARSNHVYDSFYNGTIFVPPIGGGGTKFVYAKTAAAVCAVLNKKFVFSNNNSFYLGVALGGALTRNDSKNYRSNESYKAPDGGFGIVGGVQMGYLKDISSKITFSADIAVRYYYLNYDAAAPLLLTGDKLYYSIAAFPITMGIRYMLFRSEWNTYQSLKGRFNAKRNRYY